MRKTIAFLVLVASLGAGRADARVLNGPAVRVVSERGREPGIGLRGDERGWRLTLDGRGVDSLVFVDQTVPGGDKWIVKVDGKRTVLLDRAQFVAGHAYSVEVRRGHDTLENGLVYLYPPKERRTTRVSFKTEHEESADGDIALTAKSAL